MVYILCAVALWGALQAFGCATWRDSARVSVETAHRSLIALRPAYETILGQVCMGKATICREAGDTVCQPLVECQSTRAKINELLVAAHYLSLDAMAAIDVSDEGTVSGAIAKIAALISDIRRQALDIGVDLP